jgi:hypothetical protein
VHLLYLVGFRNCASVLAQWIYSFVRHERGARLITATAPGGARRPELADTEPQRHAEHAA